MNKYIANKILFGVLIFMVPRCTNGFGVLTHEAIIDVLWEKSILPLLKEKYPSSTPEEQKEAHAYAYGGAVAPDMGYYPFCSNLFSDLVHYVRSGEMVTALIRNAENINQYAFAIGYLSHYSADNYGHPLATNKSVPIVYPKLQRKFGNSITYGDDKISHMRMEFGFDVLQIAKGNYATDKYHGLIGFKVDTAVLSKAFLETYGLDINTVFSHFQLSVEVFRWTVANIFPFITKAAWAAKGNDIVKKDSTATSKNFRFKMRRKEYNKQFGTGFRHPGFFPSLVSFFIRVLPKAGPLRSLKFKIPTAESEKYFIQSFDTILYHFAANLRQLKQPSFNLKDIDFDTGKPTALCEYSLADNTYDTWLVKLKDDKFKNITIRQKENILGFYHWPLTSKNSMYTKKCRQVFTAYTELENLALSR